MMLYAFIKKDGNIIRVGVETSVPAELQEKLMSYSQDGYVLAEASEYDTQVIKGATAGMIVDPNLPVSESTPEAPVEEMSAGVPVEEAKEEEVNPMA